MRQEFLVTHERWDPEDAQSPSLGSTATVRAAFEEGFGPTVWEHGQCLFDGDGFSLLANLGIFPEVGTVTLETWGRNDPATAIATWCSKYGWKAINLANWERVPVGAGP